jgi:hypothetical protein
MRGIVEGRDRGVNFSAIAERHRVHFERHFDKPADALRIGPRIAAHASIGRSVRAEIQG